MPADARSEILSAIRSANRDATDLTRAELDYAEIPRTYTQHAEISREQTIDLLTERLIDYNADVVPCTADQLPSAIRDALQQHNAVRVLIPEDLPRNLLPDGLATTPDTNLTPAELDGFDAAVTLCTLAIAETGTLVLQGLAGQGRRAATLVPDVHVCVLRVEDIVNTVPEAFERLASTATRPLTFVSGPSATADIEMTRIKGVHGPRQLHILLLQDSV
ncbi:MAG TPA: lactate utilization protein C [Acidobacteriaceae bacterium]|nr:lactate utilization protein C [Acidobacteriaceae bacterium]